MSKIDTSPEAARSMGVTAVSAIVDEFGLEKRALRLHFDHDVTDQDRADLLAAINLWQSRSSHAADCDRLTAENARLAKECDDAQRDLSVAKSAVAQLLEAEREACAKIADEAYDDAPRGSFDNGGTQDGWQSATQALATAIRARKA